MATFTGTSGDDTFTGGPANDSASGLGGNDTLIGGGGSDTLYGGGGNDLLNGQAGGDFMRGGAGNDRYYVFSETDNIGETDLTAAGGVDTVLAGINWTLEAGFERLTLIGEDDVNGTGNGANNLITGNDRSNVLDGAGGNDTLDGGLGNDVLIGGAGNDRYMVNSAGDVVFEQTNAPSGGSDTVMSSVTFTLGFGVENLTLQGTGNIAGTGNGVGNTINGNAGANRLNGLNGNDQLRGANGADDLSGGQGVDVLRGGLGADEVTGGAGNDVFEFTARNQGGDRITDFSNAVNNNDRFNIDASAFGLSIPAGPLPGDRFATGTDNQGNDANDRFVFNTATNQLYFDANGSASGGQTLLATLATNVNVTADDIFLV